MDFVLLTGDKQVVFTQFDDVIEHLKQQLAQWNNFGDPTDAQLIMIVKRPSKTQTIGISAQEAVDVKDVFGGLPAEWGDHQKEMYLKLQRMYEKEGIESVRRYLRGNS